MQDGDLAILIPRNDVTVAELEASSNPRPLLYFRYDKYSGNQIDVLSNSARLMQPTTM
jgi:hypothetical protein